ncbi:hypothetical protein CXF68_14980 [Tenacibaculum sp. Bg11-29]|uniref:hypothetical protein n=1 Tax=Tenacibaculum sp. Bg11-29 TaxID=2058306 RepID=UPI000C327391|nr:hypothetical protein [Tenacibaculum sp. Bg11-29]PKH51911.1 hypothetical protein CXF68_14980 [Tenacibaculum sp. Bg11-29]
MAEEKILYQKFLEDKRNYNLNVGYWKKKLQKALDEKFLIESNYVTNKNDKGKSYYDGNPIYSYVNINKRKGLRIVQENPKELENYSDIKLLQAWNSKTLLIDTYDKNEIIINELVISLYLTRSSVMESIELIKKWFSEDIENINI